jgi:putative ABC transport system permease protein
MDRFKTALIAIFAVIAIVLAAAGVYAVISYTVNQRVPEIGVRIALGAQRDDILRLVFMDGLRMTAGGVVFGVVGALGTGRLLAHWLFRVQSFDASTLAAVVLLALVVAAIACLIPQPVPLP